MNKSACKISCFPNVNCCESFCLQYLVALLGPPCLGISMTATAKLPQSSRTATAFSMKTMSGKCLANAASKAIFRQGKTRNETNVERMSLDVTASISCHKPTLKLSWMCLWMSLWTSTAKLSRFYREATAMQAEIEAYQAGSFHRWTLIKKTIRGFWQSLICYCSKNSWAPERESPLESLCKAQP